MVVLVSLGREGYWVRHMSSGLVVFCFFPVGGTQVSLYCLTFTCSCWDANCFTVGSACACPE